MNFSKLKMAFFALLGCVAATLHTGCSHAATSPAKPGGTLLRYDFTAPAAWPAAAGVAASSGDVVSIKQSQVGTIDVSGSTEPSGGLVFDSRNSKGGVVGNDGFVSGRLAVKTPETNLGKLTLSFSLSASSIRPVLVGVESFDASGKRSGGLDTLVYPAAPDFYQRYAVDLSTMRSTGTGKFNPASPWVQFRFSAASLPVGHPGSLKYQLKLDNVNYASTAYYVSPNGNNGNDGRTEATAFATPQKALNEAQGGDIVMLMDGTYDGGLNPAASFPRPGQPDGWIVLRNYPGQHPTLKSNGWNIVSIRQGNKENIYNGAPLAYIEVRGLHVRGEGDVAAQKFPDGMDKPDPRTNSNGIAVDGRFTTIAMHDFRFADNLVEYAPACGIGTIDGDSVEIENNICRYNSFTTIYGTSGISVMGSASFDGADNVYKRLVRNNICCHNETKEPSLIDNGIYTDGNGIILDVNVGSNFHVDKMYLGRTLVQSNLCYDNGGSGIHAVKSRRIDVVNNTIYMNCASPHLKFASMFTYSSSDVHFINNIVVARTRNVAAGEKPIPVNVIAGRNSSDVTFSHNVYFGGNIPPIMGDGDVIADPQFVNASVDDTVADFHLAPSSPAIGKGFVTAFSPLMDTVGVAYRLPPSLGAYER